MKAHAEGVLPDRVFGEGGDNLFRIEFVPAFGLACEHGADGGFVGGLLSVCGLEGESKQDDGENDSETGHDFPSGWRQEHCDCAGGLAQAAKDFDGGDEVVGAGERLGVAGEGVVGAGDEADHAFEHAGIISRG